MSNLKEKYKVAIAGAAGYTAGELLRILIHHPNVEEIMPQSDSQSGKKVYQIHKDLIGETNLTFVAEIDYQEVDVLFVCKGHNVSKAYIENSNIPSSVRVIDLSRDYRLEADADIFVYGLPEQHRDQIKRSTRVANPGCFATCIQLGLLPASVSGAIQADAVHVSGITGSTGAGQALSPTTHFTWRTGNASSYKTLTHQHTDEAVQMIRQTANKEVNVHFVPYRGTFARGIITTSYFETSLSAEELQQVYRVYYEKHPFSVYTESSPDVKLVVNTNKALIYVTKEKHMAVIISVIDNLLKGASGQAVQNMNLMLGLDETEGLHLKSVAF